MYLERDTQRTKQALPQQWAGRLRRLLLRLLLLSLLLDLLLASDCFIRDLRVLIRMSLTVVRFGGRLVQFVPLGEQSCSDTFKVNVMSGESENIV